MGRLICKDPSSTYLQNLAGENLCLNLVVLGNLAVAESLALHRKRDISIFPENRNRGTYVDLLLRQILVGVRTQL